MDSIVKNQNIVDELQKNSLMKWGELVVITNDIINEVIRHSDNCFIKLGNTLYELNECSKDISNTSLKTTELVSGNILQNSLRELNELLDNIKIYFDKFEQNITIGEEKLKDLEANLEKILDEMLEFKKVVKTLRVLGISTKIENSRLRTEDTGFDALAEKVEDLSLIINDKSVVIREKINVLERFVYDVSEQIIELSQEQMLQTDKILKKSNESIESLKLQYMLCSEKMQEVNILSTDLSRNISNIVKSIQFNDITKQQLQHIIEALTNENNRIQERNDTSLDEVLGCTRDVCMLQKEQLKNSKNELFKATTELVTNLRGLGDNVSKIVESTSNALNFSGKDSVKNIENNINDILKSLEKNIELNTRFVDLMKSVSTTINELISAIVDIDEVGEEIELIALNARIKATHIGKDGAALDVLAEAIQRLSIDAKFKTKGVIEIINLITTSIKELNTKLEQDVEDWNQSENKSIDYCLDLLNNLKQIDLESSNYLKSINDKINHLNNELEQSIVMVTEFSGKEFELRKLENEFDSLISDFQSLGLKQCKEKTYLNKMKSYYSMHSERIVHNQVVDSQDDNNIFASTTEENELGDNVELF